MGLISRVSSRTYRNPKLLKMADPEVPQEETPEKPKSGVEGMTAKDLETLNTGSASMMEWTDALLTNLTDFYKRQNERGEKELAIAKELQKIEVDKAHIKELVKHWDISQAEARKVLRLNDCDLDKAMLVLAKQ